MCAPPTNELMKQIFIVNELLGKIKRLEKEIIDLKKELKEIRGQKLNNFKPTYHISRLPPIN